MRSYSTVHLVLHVRPALVSPSPANGSRVLRHSQPWSSRQTSRPAKGKASGEGAWDDIQFGSLRLLL